MDDFWLDLWRYGNATLALIAIVFDLRWLRRGWHEMSPQRRAQMASLVAVLGAILYGSLEQVINADLHLRVPILTVAIAIAICAHFLPNTTHATNRVDPNRYPN